jgi:hypothetical protein
MEEGPPSATKVPADYSRRWWRFARRGGVAFGGLGY